MYVKDHEGCKDCRERIPTAETRSTESRGRLNFHQTMQRLKDESLPFIILDGQCGL